MFKAWLLAGVVWLLVAGVAQAGPTAAECDGPAQFDCTRELTARREPQRFTIISDWNRSYVYGYTTGWQVVGGRTFDAGACRFCKDVVELGCRAYGRARHVRVVENSCGPEVRATYRSTGPRPVPLTLNWSTLTG